MITVTLKTKEDIIFKRVIRNRTRGRVFLPKEYKDITMNIIPIQWNVNEKNITIDEDGYKNITLETNEILLKEVVGIGNGQGINLPQKYCGFDILITPAEHIDYL